MDGPLSNDTIIYGYDELGRVTSRNVNGVSTATAYDALGRISAETNVQGQFTFGYDGVSFRLASIAYPNGQTSSFSYYGNAADHHLQAIHHKRADFSTLLRFDYTYDALGNIQTWRQQLGDEPASVWSYAYDVADQLVSATKRTDATSPSILKRYAYAYDAAGNRTTEQIDDNVTVFTYSSLNRLSTRQPGGALRFVGSVSEPAVVSIAGRSAPVTADGRFQGTAAIGSGTSQVTIAATDASGNTAAAVFEVDALGSATTFTHDSAGNITSDGVRSFEWDAQHRLVAVASGQSRREIEYDALHRRSRERQRQNGVLVSERRLLWCELGICEERDATGATTTALFTMLGGARTSAPFFLAQDHTGTVWLTTDGSSNVSSRFDYDPYGRYTRISGTANPGLGFAQTWNDVEDSVSMALYRTYDPGLGRWLNEDPIGQIGGLNQYTYSNGNPVNASDPLGLDARIRCERIKGHGFFRDLVMAMANANHCYIEINCAGSYHDTLEIYGPQAGFPNGKPMHQASKDSRNKGTLWRPITGGCNPCSENPCYFEDELIKSYEEQAKVLPTYQALGPNSNSFVRRVVEGACGEAKFPGGAHGSDK